MNELLFTLSILLSVSISPFSQVEYDISSYQGKYEELDTYNSVALETEGDIWWTKSFDLDFNFPFYDTMFNKLICTHNSVCYFDGSKGLNLFLFTAFYRMDRPESPSDLDSDVRYAYVESMGQQALVLQYTKNRLATDTTIEQHNSQVNFQVWLFESGDIEIRFGKIDLEDSPNYIPGSGFYSFIDGWGFLEGPYVGLQHPDSSESAGFGIEGSYDSFTVDDIGIIHTVPPEGYVIKFERQSTTNIIPAEKHRVSIYPNPTSDFVTVNSDTKIQEVKLLSSRGQTLRRFKDRIDRISLNGIPKGIYYMEIITKSNRVLEKVVKN